MKSPADNLTDFRVIPMLSFELLDGPKVEFMPVTPFVLADLNLSCHRFTCRNGITFRE